MALAEVNPIVQSPLRLVDATFERAGGEAGEKFFTHFCVAVTVAIGKKNNVRRAGDDDAAARGTNAVGGRQVVGENFRRVHDTVAVAVAQKPDRAVSSGPGRLLGLLVGLDAAHFAVELAGLVQFLDVVLAFEIVAVEFAHKKPAVLVPTNAGWFANERFAGDEFETEARRQLHESGALGGGQRLGRVGRPLDFGTQRRGQTKDQRHAESNGFHRNVS